VLGSCKPLPGWLWTRSLLTSASLVTRIIGVRLWCLAELPIFFIVWWPKGKKFIFFFFAELGVEPRALCTLVHVRCTLYPEPSPQLYFFSSRRIR
jgi:hypothetical protein